MNILALDLACKTGWAHTDGTSGLQDFDWSKLPYGARWAAFRGWLRAMLADGKTDGIAYEAALHQKGAAAKVANAMVSVVEEECHRWNIKCKGYHAMTIKKHATGSGRAKKPDMWEAAKKRGIVWTPESDDVIDALWLLDLALNDHEWSAPTIR